MCSKRACESHLTIMKSLWNKNIGWTLPYQSLKKYLEIILRETRLFSIIILQAHKLLFFIKLSQFIIALLSLVPIHSTAWERFRLISKPIKSTNKFHEEIWYISQIISFWELIQFWKKDTVVRDKGTLFSTEIWCRNVRRATRHQGPIMVQICALGPWLQIYGFVSFEICEKENVPSLTGWNKMISFIV